MSVMTQNIKQILHEQPTMEGAGVRLHRVFGYHHVPKFDPFLLLDHFGSDNPADYLKGFPWHPHRGIETVTYMLTGSVEHGDSIGNKGIIQSGDVQWMTAGSGIIHQEMPQRYDGTMQGFQLWVNLPAEKKMIDPKYRELTQQDIPVFEQQGIKTKVIAGTFEDITGPITDLQVAVNYFDIEVSTATTFQYTPKKQYTTFIYIINGGGNIDGSDIRPGDCVLFDKDNPLVFAATNNLRFLLISGKPLSEPVAWGGPIVMNTQQELDNAFQELNQGTFIKHQG